MKYINEFKRAFKIAAFMAAGVFIGYGLIPWITTSDKTVANQRLLGILWGIVGIFAAAVALLFVNEIIRTKRLAKKKAQRAAQKAAQKEKKK